MLSRLERTRYLGALIVFAVLLVGCNPVETPPSATVTATDVPATSTDTPVPPTATPVPPTDTSTPLPSATDTPTDTNTPTPIPPSLEVSQNAVCRIGPGLAYPIESYLVPGDVLIPSGFVDGETRWWFGAFETEQEEITCWISEQVVALSGDASILPTLTPPPLPTASPTPTSEKGEIYYFLVAEDTGGPFGCGDGLVMVYPGIPRTGNFQKDVTAALNALFSNNHKYYNGFYNPMHASSLRVGDVDSPSGGETRINLAGNLAKPKDKCESQRMRDQVWMTVQQQFSEAGHAVIWMNNALLGDLLVVAK